MGTIRYAMGDFPTAIEMIHRKTVDLDSLILKRFALTEISGVFEETIQSPENMLRSIMVV